MPEASAPKVVAGKPAIIARRYARALFDLADKKGQMDPVVTDLRLLRDLLRTDAGFRRLVHGRHMTRPEQKKILDQIVAMAQLHPIVRGFLELLYINNRLSFLGVILRAFKADLAAQRGEHTAEVFAAKPLTDAQSAQLAGELAKATGGKVEIVMMEDPSLLGGFKVKMGSFLIDASVKGKLAQMEKHLKSQGTNAAA